MLLELDRRDVVGNAFGTQERYLVLEVVGRLERAVDAREPEVGDLVELAERAQDRQADLVTGHLGQEVEDALRLAGAAEIPANEVGLAILGPLRELDEVAYLRFASVYRAFESADDFEAEIALLRAERPVTDESSVSPVVELVETPELAHSAPSG